MNWKAYIVEIVMGSIFISLFISLFVMLIVSANTDFILPDSMIVLFETMTGIFLGYFAHGTFSNKRKYEAIKLELNDLKNKE